MARGTSAGGSPTRRRVRARLTSRGLVFLAASVVAILGAYTGGRITLLYVGALLAALPLIALIAVRLRIPRFAVTRSFSPSIVSAGTSTTVMLTVRNLGRTRSAAARWSDELPWSEGSTPDALLPSCPVGRSVTIGYELRPPRRGMFGIGPLTVTLADELGLAWASAKVGESHLLTVTPEVIPLTASGLSTPAGDGEAVLVQRRATGDEDDSMTREYRAGDAMRRVHWRASARHGDLMVRQEEQRSLPRARIIVDTRHAGYRDALLDVDDVESPSFEWVVRMLASVSVHLRRQGYDVTIGETASPQLQPDSTGRRKTWGDERLLIELATLSLADDRAVQTERPAVGPVIALLADAEPMTVHWLAAQRAQGELGVAFIVRRTSAIEVIDRTFRVPTDAGPAAERLVDAGWLVVTVRSDDDHLAAWQAVVVETGRSRGFD
jgi:uncharacterized protein (DUF58 family)